MVIQLERSRQVSMETLSGHGRPVVFERLLKSATSCSPVFSASAFHLDRLLGTPGFVTVLDSHGVQSFRQLAMLYTGSEAPGHGLPFPSR